MKGFQATYKSIMSKSIEVFWKQNRIMYVLPEQRWKEGT